MYIGDEPDEGLVPMPSDGKTNAPGCEEEELVNRKLFHLNQTGIEGIKRILSKYPEIMRIFSWK